MDTDTLREKFIRSGDALNRLGDDIKGLVFCRYQKLKESQEYLETLIKEKEVLDIQLNEQEAKIAAHKEEINNKNNLKEELLNKQKNYAKEAQEKEIHIEELKNEKKNVIEGIENINREIDNLKITVSQKREQIAEMIKTNHKLELKFRTDLNFRENEINKIKEDIDKIKEENAVISYILEESAEDIPEVDILAAVMKLGRTNKEQLKQELNNIISPVIITRTINRMAEKNLISYDESRDVVSL